MPDRPPRADGAAHAPRSERAYRCVGIPTFSPCRVCAAASASATLQTRLTSDAGLRAYRWWLRRIATSLRGFEDAYLLGRGSLVCALVAVACASGVALLLGSVPAVASNGLLAGAGPAALRANFSRESCGGGLNATTAAQAMLLSAHFLLYNQRPEGHFIEVYNWTGRRALQPADDDEAQAAALRALAGFYREVRATHERLGHVYPKGLQARLHEAIMSSVGFFEANSRTTRSGARFIVWPGKSLGKLSVLSQVALAMVDVKRSLSAGPMPRGVNLNAPTYAQTAQAWLLDRSLREIIAMVLKLRLPNGRFIRTYEANGRPRKQHTERMHEAHSESLALLLLVSVAKYCDRGDLLPQARASAAALLRAYLPPRDHEVGGNRGAGGEGTVGGLSSDAAAVLFFRHGGMALAELADVDDSHEGLLLGGALSIRDRAAERPSAWAAKMLLLRGWGVVDGIIKGWRANRRDGMEQLEFVDDLSAQKPADWLDNEPQLVPDAQALRPEGWRDEEDGVWEPPLIANPKCRRLPLPPNCGEWRPPKRRNPYYAKLKDGDPGGKPGEGVGGTAVAAAAVAARVAWRKSEGKGKDLEDEMGKRFACHAASALVVSARRQIGGPLAAYNSARAAPMRFGAHRPDTYGFRFNASRCHAHVRKSISGSLAARKAKAAKKAAEAEAARSAARQIHVTPGEGVSMAEMLRRSLDDGGQAADPVVLSECERAKHAHERCTNDNPVGQHGFQSCCRALAGFLFACFEDRSMLPPHLRALYMPSYSHHCTPNGHAELPPDFAEGFMPERVSEFAADRLAANDDACDLAALGLCWWWC